MDWHKRFLQQAAWTGQLRSYLFAGAGMDRAHRVLEVGCGTGAILADLHTPAAMHALDRDGARLIEMRRHVPGALPVRGDALALPYQAGVFNVTFCHFLLLWVQDPLKALQEMKRVTCPGGSLLALAEPDHGSRRDEPAQLAPLGRLQTEALRRQGADPGLGSRLAGLFHQAGIHILETGILGGGGDFHPAPAERDLEWELLEADLAGHVPPGELSQLKKLEARAWEQGQRVLDVPTHYAWGRV